MFSVLEEQIRECFGRITYTHKTHMKMADICAGHLSYVKVAQIALAALTASGAFAVIFTEGMLLKIATAFVSIFTLCLSGYMKGFDPGGAAQKHRDAAAKLWPLRESYLSLLTDIRMSSVTDEDARQKRDELQSKVATVYEGAPQTTARAYKMAQTALKEAEELTFSDAEIDAFVPEGLRKSHDKPK